MPGIRPLQRLLLLTSLAFACGDDTGAAECTTSECDDPTCTPADCDAPTLRADQALATIDRVEQSLRDAHPRTIDGLPSEVQAAFADARAAIDGSIPTSRLAGLLSTALVPLGDGHTRIELPAATRWLDLPFVWTADGPVLSQDAGPLRRGDLLVALDGRAWSALLNGLADHVPHENASHLRAVAPALLVRQDVLAWLDVVPTGPVDLVIERDGRHTTHTLAFTDTPPAAPAPQPPRATIDAARGVAVLRLDACVYDEAYQAALDGMLAEAQQRGVTDIVVDLRNNEGGDVTVAAALLARLGRPWTAFSVEQRVSDGFLAAFPVFASPDVQAALMAFGVDVSAPVWSIPGDVLAALLAGQLPPPTDAPFSGSVHALIGPRTFSSAHLFAELIRDNGLGVLFGEPTGNAASFWGQDYAIDLPDAGFALRVATARNIRIAADGRDAATLSPDVPLELRREHILAGEDRVLAEVLDHLTEH